MTHVNVNTHLTTQNHLSNLNYRALNSLQYLELRFNGHVRTIASVMFVIDEVSFSRMR